MNKTEILTLIDGEFTIDDAKDILNNIILSKIDFHSIKNWSSQERFGEEDAVAQKRIPELRNELKKLVLIMEEAKVNNKKLVVKSEINISLIDD